MIVGSPFSEGEALVHGFSTAFKPQAGDGTALMDARDTQVAHHPGSPPPPSVCKNPGVIT